MKLEIDIPSIIYNDAKENRGYISVGKMEIAWKAIADGKPIEQEPKSEWEHDHEILKAYSDGADEVLDKIRAEIAEYGSIIVSYAITKDTKTDKGIEKLVSGVLKQAKEQVLEIIDKYKAEIEPQESENTDARY